MKYDMKYNDKARDRGPTILFFKGSPSCIERNIQLGLFDLSAPLGLVSCSLRSVLITELELDLAHARARGARKTAP